jgi:hypothetical protein
MPFPHPLVLQFKLTRVNAMEKLSRHDCKYMYRWELALLYGYYIHWLAECGPHLAFPDIAVTHWYRTRRNTHGHTPHSPIISSSRPTVLIVHNRPTDQHILLDSYKLDWYADGPAIFTKREKGKDYYYNRPLWWTSAIHTCPCPYIHGALLKEQDSPLSSFIIHQTINLLLFRPIILRESSN